MSRWQRALAGLMVGLWLTAVLTAVLYVLSALARGQETSARHVRNLASESMVYGGIIGAIAGFIGGWRALPRWRAVLCFVWAFLGAHAAMCLLFFLVNKPPGDWAALGRWLGRTIPAMGLASVLSGLAAVALLQRFGVLPPSPHREPPRVVRGAGHGRG